MCNTMMQYFYRSYSIYPGGGHGNPLQYSCLENPIDRGAWQATDHSVAKSWTRLKQLSMHMYSLYTYIFVKVKVLVAHSYSTLCDRMDCSLPGSSVHGILQARILERVAIPFSRGSSQPGIEQRSPALQVDPLPAEPQGKPLYTLYIYGRITLLYI